MSPKLAECVYFPTSSITISFHIKWPKYSNNNKSSVEQLTVTSSKIATGVIISSEASAERVINVYLIWDFVDSGVNIGLRSPPPGWSAAIAVPDASHNIYLHHLTVFYAFRPCVLPLPDFPPLIFNERFSFLWLRSNKTFPFWSLYSDRCLQSLICFLNIALQSAF